MAILFFTIILCVGAILLWKHLARNHDSRWSNQPPSAGTQQPQKDYSELKERYKKYQAASSRWAEAQPDQQPNWLPSQRSNGRETDLEPANRHWAPIGEDHWDDDYLDDYATKAKTRRLVGIGLHIHFVDRNGNATDRAIRTLRYAHDPDTGGGVVHAFCHLRKAPRQFAFSRIKRCIDRETGEVVENLGAFLDAACLATPVGVVDDFLNEHRAGLFVLFSFAKADSAMRAKERRIMLDWARSHGLSDEAALASLEAETKKDWRSTDYAFWEAVKAVKREAREDAYMQSLWNAIQAILNSDKQLSEQEKQYLKYAAKQWGFQVPG